MSIIQASATTQQTSNQATSSPATDTKDAKALFLDYMKKSPAERYYEALLADKGLTKEELERLPPEERAKIEEEIKAEIKKHTNAEIEKQTGIRVA